jgi:hypothetical protein
MCEGTLYRWLFIEPHIEQRSRTEISEFVPARYTVARALEGARDDICTQGLDGPIWSETSLETTVIERTIPHIVHSVTEVLMNGYV